jgi:hypothetical protein
MTTSSVDQLEEILRPSATRELYDTIKQVRPVDMTVSEILGLLAILRPTLERLKVAEAAPAPLIQLRPVKSERVKR